MNVLKLKLRKSLSYLLLPVMILFSFSAFAYNSYGSTQSAFAYNSYGSTQSAFANSLEISNPPSFSENYGATSKQQSLTINNLPLTINTNPFKFSDAYYDNESGLYYLHARYYSPELMRFINRDSYDLSNRYSYCDGEPVSQTDPSGHMSKLATGLINFGAAAIIGFVLGAILPESIPCLGSFGPALIEGITGAASTDGANLIEDKATSTRVTGEDMGIQAAVGLCLGLLAGLGGAKLKACWATRAELGANSSSLEPLASGGECGSGERDAVPAERIPPERRVRADSVLANYLGPEGKTILRTAPPPPPAAAAAVSEPAASADVTTYRGQFNPGARGMFSGDVTSGTGLRPAAAAGGGGEEEEEEEEVMVQEFKGGFRAAARAARRGRLPKAPDVFCY